MSTEQNRVCGLDILKAICAFLVISIHAPFPGVLGTAFLRVCRIAVPIFFMITGYFYSDLKRQAKQLIQIKKNLVLFAVSNLLYFLWGLCISILKDGYTAKYFVQTINTQSLLTWVFFNDSPFAGHLWYLGAILYVLLIVLILDSMLPNYGMKVLYCLTPILLIMDLLFGKYSLLLLQKEFPVFLTRNFLCMGIPYFTIGNFLREHDNQVRLFGSKKFLLVLLILLCIFTTAIESSLLIRYNLSTPREHYISTTFLSILVFIAFTSCYWNGKKTLLFQIGKNHTLFIYILHPIVITILSEVMSPLPINEIYLYFRPIIVYLFSVLISVFLVIVRKKVYNSNR